jgi:peptide/nickel transport system permease protein
LRTGAWWAFVPPTLLLTLVAFALLMLQSSLDEVFNPRLRGGRKRSGRSTVGAGAALAQIGVVADATLPAESTVDMSSGEAEGNGSKPGETAAPAAPREGSTRR